MKIAAQVQSFKPSFNSFIWPLRPIITKWKINQTKTKVAKNLIHQFSVTIKNILNLYRYSEGGQQNKL